MEGSYFTRALRALSYLSTHPKHAILYLNNRLSRSTAIKQKLPWISWPAIDYLKETIKPGMRVFEWGAGGSTIYFAKKGCFVTSIESNESWYNLVLSELKQSNLNAEIRLINAESRNPKLVKEYISSVEFGGPWDVILVDGLEEEWIGRMDCVRNILEKSIFPKIIILDDAWRNNYSIIPTLFPGYKRRIFRGVGPARPGVTQTDVYYQ